MIPLLGAFITLLNHKPNIMATQELINVFTDTEITIVHLKKILAENGIESLIKNDNESGVSAGFVAGTVTSVDLYIFAKDEEKARPIIENFVANLEK